jgi:hypothetical protein
VIGVWLAQVLWLDRLISSWIANRLVLAALGAAMLPLAVRRLKDAEHQLSGSGA